MRKGGRKFKVGYRRVLSGEYNMRVRTKKGEQWGDNGDKKERRIEMGEIEIREEGIMTGKWKVRKEKWRIVGVYVNEDLEK